MNFESRLVSAIWSKFMDDDIPESLREKKHIKSSRSKKIVPYCPCHNWNPINRRVEEKAKT